MSGTRTRQDPTEGAPLERDGLVVEGKVEIDPAYMAVFVGGEGLAVLLMEHFGVEERRRRFLELERLRITVERAG